MKKILLIVCCLLVFNTISNTLFAQKTIAVAYVCDLEFHRPKFDCKKGFWICFTNCHWEYTYGKEVRNNNNPKAFFLLTEDGKVELTILEDLDKNENYSSEDLTRMVGTEEDEFYLPEALAKAFGVKSVKIKAGEYKVEKKGEGVFGVVRFDAEIEK